MLISLSNGYTVSVEQGERDKQGNCVYLVLRGSTSLMVDACIVPTANLWDQLKIWQDWK